MKIRTDKVVEEWVLAVWLPYLGWDPDVNCAAIIRAAKKDVYSFYSVENRLPSTPLELELWVVFAIGQHVKGDRHATRRDSDRQDLSSQGE